LGEDNKDEFLLIYALEGEVNGIPLTDKGLFGKIDNMLIELLERIKSTEESMKVMRLENERYGIYDQKNGSRTNETKSGI
jgi:hypothetical protein